MLLKAKEVADAKPGKKLYRLRDGNGLYAEVRPSGQKFWRYRYRIYPHGWDKKDPPPDQMYTIGRYGTTGTDERLPGGKLTPEEQKEALKRVEDAAQRRRDAGVYTLEEARKARDEARARVKQGIHPIHHKRAQDAREAAQAITNFKGVATAWIERRSKRKNWSTYYRAQVESVIEAEASRFIGGLPITQVTAQHLTEIVDRVEERGAHTVAILLRQWLNAIFRYAIRQNYTDSNPASALKGDEDERPPVRHHPHLEERDIAAFLAAVDGYSGEEWVRLMMRLLPLVFTRPSELREAPWWEFDLDKAEWLIPAERMKMREPHIVPLSRQAVVILKRLREISGHREYVFPNRRDPKRPASNTTVNEAIRRMGYKGRISAHGFRGTASTALYGMHFKADVIERQLAHKERNKSRAAYDHAQYLPERLEMAQAWADHLDALCSGANVISIGNGKRA